MVTWLRRRDVPTSLRRCFVALLPRLLISSLSRCVLCRCGVATLQRCVSASVLASVRSCVLASLRPCVLASSRPRVLASSRPRVLASSRPRVLASSRPRVLASLRHCVLASSRPCVIASLRACVLWSCVLASLYALYKLNHFLFDQKPAPVYCTLCSLLTVVASWVASRAYIPDIAAPHHAPRPTRVPFACSVFCSSPHRCPQLEASRRLEARHIPARRSLRPHVRSVVRPHVVRPGVRPAIRPDVQPGVVDAAVDRAVVPLASLVCRSPRCRPSRRHAVASHRPPDEALAARRLRRPSSQPQRLLPLHSHRAHAHDEHAAGNQVPTDVASADAAREGCAEAGAETTAHRARQENVEPVWGPQRADASGGVTALFHRWRRLHLSVFFAR